LNDTQKKKKHTRNPILQKKLRQNTKKKKTKNIIIVPIE
jgi:hypothetical protein